MTEWPELGPVSAPALLLFRTALKIGPTLSHGTICGTGNVPYLCFPAWWPFATNSYLNLLVS